MEAFTGALVAAGIVLAALVALLITIKSLIVIVPPNSAAVITGRSRQLTDGRGVGYRTVIGGRTLRIPIIEEVAWMPLATIPIELNVQNAFSKGGIPLSVQAVGNIKVASEPESTFNNGVERLLGKHVDEIEELAKETLSANLRGVLASMTPEEVNEDRLKFAAQLLEEADQDLQKLGLQLDTLKIQNVTDEVGYLAAVGRAKTAQVLKGAQIAEAQNEAETKQRQAEAMRVAEVARAEAEMAVATARNELRVRQAQLNQEAETTERVAKVEAQRAEVEAQQNLESQRVELQKRKLLADVVEPAEAQRKAAELRAIADAAPILENGKAQVEVLKLLYSQISNAGEQGFAVFMAEKLPMLLGTAVDAVKGIEIDRLVVMDGGSGDGVSNAANQRVNAAFRTLEGLGSAFGIDIQSVLQGAARKMETPAVPAAVATYPSDKQVGAKK
ncbi:MAG TPA: SPFH domain-containing protein [Gemmatimonadaceae bacterium]|nr:SPFH domain-containing protein [Gemmatimonadaceae bacterium]